jgi:hypothetical protein
MSPMTRTFVATLENFVSRQGIPLVQFCPGQRKDAVMTEHLRHFAGEEAVVFVGKAQENTPVFRTERRRSPTTGRPYPWIVRRSAMVNNYYIYAVDRDFGPFFLKFCSYFPFNAKLCLNGHEYAKRQLAQEGIAARLAPAQSGERPCLRVGHAKLHPARGRSRKPTICDSSSGELRASHSTSLRTLGSLVFLTLRSSR